MTVLSLVRPALSWPPGGEYWLRALFGAGRLQSPSKVRRLGFIHFARMSFLPGFPDRGQGREDVGHALLLFESNYDGAFSQYIDVFSKAIPVKMRAFWSNSRGFPGVDPVTPFKSYIEANEFSVDHFYCAYPDASPATVSAALRLQSQHAAFRARTRNLDPDEFQAEYLAFLTEVQDDL